MKKTFNFSITVTRGFLLFASHSAAFVAGAVYAALIVRGVV